MKQFFKILLYFLIISICIGQRPYYKGEWKKNRYHGNGELLDKFGNKYVGEFFEGIKHGRGVLKYSNGARFEGQFIDGKKTEGTYYYSNGTKYIGKWKRGKKHGNGMFVNRDGVKENQTWANGKIQIEEDRETIKNESLAKIKILDKDINKIKSDSLSKKSEENQLKLKISNADKLFLLAKHNDAKTIYEDILKLDSLNAETYARLGNIFYDIDNYELANEKYQKALELDDKSVSALNGLGNINYQNSNFDEAIKLYLEAYKNANSLEVSTAIIVDNLANTYNLIGKKEEAIQYYEQLSALNYANPNLVIQLWLADAYSDNNQLDESDAILNKLLNVKERGSTITSYMGDDISVMSFKGSEKNRVKYLYSEDHIKSRLSMNNHYRESDQKTLKKSNRINKEIDTASSSQNLYLKGKDLYFDKQFKSAIDTLKLAIKSKIRNEGDAYYYIAQSYIGLEEYEKAIDLIRQSDWRKMEDMWSPKSLIKVMESQSTAFYGAGHLDSCINRLQEILLKIPDDKSLIVYNLGVLYKDIGDSVQAINFYKKLFNDEGLAKQYYNLPSKTRTSLESTELIHSFENKVTIKNHFAPIDLARKYFNLGLLNFDVQNLDKAVHCFIKSYDLDDDYIFPLNALFELSKMGHEAATKYLQDFGHSD